MKEIYLIEKLYINHMNNQQPYEYKLYGFISSWIDTHDFIERGGNISKSRCWAFREDMAKYRFQRIKEIEL